jgi:hypothetical protein
VTDSVFLAFNSGIAFEARTAPLFSTIPAVNASQARPLNTAKHAKHRYHVQ